jgi:exopolysaccharide biosynthesis polyprenyl glycosylphosphotransferase
MKKSELFFTAVLVPLDFLMICAAAGFAYFLRFTRFAKEIRPVKFDLLFFDYMALTVFVAAGALIIFAFLGLYNIYRKQKVLRDLSTIFVGVSTTVAAISFYVFLRAELFSSRFLVIATWTFAIIFVFCGRFFLRLFQRFLYRFGIGVHRLVLIGQTEAASRLKSRLARLYSGYQVVAVFSEFNSILLEKLKKTSQYPGIDDIIQTNPDLPKDQVLDLIDFAYENKIDFKYIPDLFGAKSVNVEADVVAGYPLMELKHTPLDGWGRIFKRIFDFIGALILLILVAPIFPIVALLIRLDSKGPVFVRLLRIGKDKSFYLYKFRSMIKGAHLMKKELLKFSEREGPLFKMREDPRITRVGRVLRRLKIDELPQFINVLIGELSLVGPRPHEPEEVAQYEKHHRKVLLIKPGITGMAQVAGGAELDFENEVKLDTFYIENWSPSLDLHILIKTMNIVFRGVGAY